MPILLDLPVKQRLSERLELSVPNRPFYRYGSHIELIRFKDVQGGMSTFRLYFRALFETFFLKVFLE